jgi:two-component system nitrate/nitrite response regulator NarL
VSASVASLDELPTLTPHCRGLLIVGLGTADDLPLLERIAAAKQDYTVVAVTDAPLEPAQLALPSTLLSAADGFIANIRSSEVLVKLLELALLGQKLVVLGSKHEDSDLSPGGRSPLVMSDKTASHEGNGNGNVLASLTDRELEVLGQLACGGSNKVIARTCRISESTVKIHVKSILRKVQAQNRTQAAIWAIHHNLAAGDHPGSAGVAVTF